MANEIDMTPDGLGTVESMGELRARLTDLVVNGSDEDLLEAASALDMGNMLLEGAKQAVAIGTHKCGGTACNKDHYPMVGMLMTLSDADGNDGGASAIGQKIGGGIGHLSIQLTPMTDDDYAHTVAMMSGLEGNGQTRH